MYGQDGVTCLRGAFDQHWIDVARRRVDYNLADLIGAGRGALPRARARCAFSSENKPLDPNLQSYIIFCRRPGREMSGMVHATSDRTVE
jgi:hypothetical protein